MLKSRKLKRSTDTSAAEPLRVGLVVGEPLEKDLDKVHCGVRDYANCLACALRDIGIDASVIAPQSWGIKGGSAFVRALRAAPLDVVHVQYPSIGQRYSLLPHVLGRIGTARRSVVTLHEHSILPHAQRGANAIFRLTTDRIVFTTDYEARAFRAAGLSPVIPIGSNVPIHPGTPQRDNTVLYFGQIRARKGLEAFIALAHLADRVGEAGRFLVIGSVPPRWFDYARMLRSSAPARVSWMDNASPAAVAEAMATAQASFLPFPDGAGFRRGSMLAALANGLPVIAPLGASTADELRRVLFLANTPEQALAQLQMIRAVPEVVAQRVIAGRRLVQRFNWATIAEQHNALYQRLLGGGESVLDGKGRLANLQELVQRIPSAGLGKADYSTFMLRQGIAKRSWDCTE